MNLPLDASISGRIAEAALARPDATAVIDGDRHVSFSDLCAGVDRLAGWLDQQGVAPGAVVSITVPDNFQHLMASLALMRLGCVQITLSRRDSQEARLALATRCRVSVSVITDEAVTIGGVRVLRPDIDAIISDTRPPPAALSAPDPDSIAMLCPSSGTTGKAKIMAISQTQILERSGVWRIGAPGKVVYRALTLDIDVAKRESIIALLGGSTILVTLPRDALDIVRLSEAHGVETLLLSPGQARDLVSVAEASTSRLFPDRIVIQISGGAVGAPFCQAASRLLSPKIEIRYGATECGTTTEGDIQMFDIDENAVGYLLPGAVVETVDENDRLLPRGTFGRLRIRSPGMLSGYFDDAEQSALAFRDGWFYPRDVGRVTEDNLLIYEGRADEMMVLESLNIFPSEIERVVEDYPGIDECAAFARKSPVHGDIPVVAIVSADDIDQRALLDYCRRRLGVRSPRRILQVSELPRSDAGKILRRELQGLLQT